MKKLYLILLCVTITLSSCGDSKGEKNDNSNVPDLSTVKFVDVSYSGDHWGALSEEGKLYMWGNNEKGQIGTGDKGNFHSIVNIMDDVEQIELGSGFSTAIDKDGYLYVWGDNSKGQLGDGTLELCFSPKKIMENVSDVCISGSSVMAITKDGELFVWGNNEEHWFADQDSNTINSPIKIMDNVEKIYNFDFPYVITNDGKLYTFNDESTEVTGGIIDAYYDDYTLYTITKKDVLVHWLSTGVYSRNEDFLENVCRVASSGFKGNEFSGALSSDGVLYMWGRNFDHRCEESDQDPINKPTEVLSNIKQFELGSESSYAVDNNDVLYSWGQNNVGQLCNGSTQSHNAPTPVIANVSKIKVWGSCIAIITNDGQLYIGGSAGSFDEEDGNYSQFETPICINDKSKLVDIITKADNTIQEDNGLDYNGLPGGVGFGDD